MRRQLEIRQNRRSCRFRHRRPGVRASTIDFHAWQPSTWPPAPAAVDTAFVATLRRIFCESILDEIRNVISDIVKSNGDLQHRGHVVALSLMCAIEAVSAYGYKDHKNGGHMAEFITNHFPSAYRPFAATFYGLYRNSLVHSLESV